VPQAPNWRTNPRAKDYVRIIELAAEEHGIDPELLGSVIERESQFDPRAESEAGAQGIAQLMPQYFSDVDVADPVASIRAAAKYLKDNIKRFGDVPRALAAYNHGPTAVRSYGDEWRDRIPRETRNYLDALAPDTQDIVSQLRKDSGT
jgi:soluble lytic murein transglycosylase-like protein